MRIPLKAMNGEELVWTLLRDRGFRAHWGQSGEDAVIERLFDRKRNGFYVDIGCHHPRELSNTYVLSRFYDWTGINVDASPEAIRLFQEARPKDININTLIGDGGEPLEFVLFKDLARSTADKQTIADLKRRGFAIISSTTMTPRTLKSILDEHVKPNQQIDLLSVDIESLDLAALKTSDWRKYRPKVVCVEDHEFKHKDGETEIRRFMREVGYKIVSHCFDTSLYAPKE